MPTRYVICLSGKHTPETRLALFRDEDLARDFFDTLTCPPNHNLILREEPGDI